MKSKKYLKQDLIKRLIELKEEIGRVPIAKDLSKIGLYHQIYITYFGSWNNALISAGLHINKIKKYSEEELLSFLKQKAHELGRTPIIDDLKTTPNYRTYQLKYGSVTKALLAAGLKPIGYYSDEELIGMLKGYHTQFGKIPRAKDFPKNPSYTVITDRFGTWNNALKIAGLFINKKSITREDMIKIIQQEILNLNRIPTLKEIIKFIPQSRIEKEFKSYNQLISLLGYTPNDPSTFLIPNKRYSDVYLLEKLKELKEKLGYISWGIANEYGISASVYARHFGSWNNALRRAGLTVNTSIMNDKFRVAFWKAWQRHCEEMARAMYDPKWIRYQKSDFTDKNPDMLIITKRKHIDAKLSGYDYFQEQIDEYTQQGCKLEFWCIWKGIENISNTKVKYYYVEELAGIMKALDRDDMAKKCYLFKHGIIPDCYQTELYTFVNNKK